MAAGEALAAQCAGAQAQLAPSRRAAGFLDLQSRQERTHARIFRAGALLLGSLRRDDFAVSLFHPVRRRLAGDLAAGRFAASLVGMQVVVEALGAVILSELDALLLARGAPFAATRREILRQESSHHAFGVRWVERLLVTERAVPREIARAAEDYVAALEQVLDRCRDLAADLDRQPEALIPAFRAALPAWLADVESVGGGCP